MSFLSFKAALHEAAFKGTALQPVCDRIKAILERRIGKKMYQYGGESYVQQFQKATTGEGIGILYLLNITGEAFRLNWEKKNAKQLAITSCDYWKKWKIGEEDHPNPDRVVMGLEWLNSVQLVDALERFLKAPTQREVKLTIDEAAGTLDLATVARAAYHELGTAEITVKDLKQISRRLGRKVNQYQLSKLPRGKRGTVNVTMLLDTDVGESESTIDPIADKIEKTVDKVPVEVLFKDLADLSDLVINNNRPSLVVTGAGGTGKSFTVKERIKASGIAKGREYNIQKGYTSVFGLYMSFFMNRNNKLLVFDDCDDVFKDITSQNLLKAALDSDEPRELSWSSRNTIPIDQGLDANVIAGIEQGIEDQILAGGDPETGRMPKLPSTFRFKGRVIFISNLSWDKIPQPVVSRSLLIDIALTDNEMLERMKSVLPVIAKDTGVSDVEAESVLNRLITLADDGKISKPTMRTLPAAINIMKSGMPRWESLLKYAAVN